MALSFISNNIYSLKRDYGQSVSIYKKRTVLDVESGMSQAFISKINIQKVIIMNSKEYESFHSVPMPKTVGRQFDYGGYFALADRVAIVDRKDLKGMTIDQGDYLICKGRRYDMSNIHLFEDDRAYVLDLREIGNEPIEQIVEPRIRSRFTLRQDLFVTVTRNFSFTDILGFTHESKLD